MTASHFQKPSRPLVRIFGFGILLAAVLLLVFGSNGNEQVSRRVIVGDTELAHVFASWQKTWQRQPTTEELEQALNGYIREEVLYREALYQGLDKNNSLVKRALVTQMNMIAESQADPEAITEADLEAYYALRSETFKTDTKYTFKQIFFSPERRGDEAENNARQAVKELNRQSNGRASIDQLGDVIMIDQNYDQVTSTQIDRQFGKEFREQLASLPEGEWRGPIRSAFGWHAVFVENVTPGRLLPIEDVRGEIMRDLEYEERQAAKEQFFTELMQQYDIVYKGEINNLLDAE